MRYSLLFIENDVHAPEVVCYTTRCNIIKHPSAWQPHRTLNVDDDVPCPRDCSLFTQSRCNIFKGPPMYDNPLRYMSDDDLHPPRLFIIYTLNEIFKYPDVR